MNNIRNRNIIIAALIMFYVSLFNGCGNTYQHLSADEALHMMKTEENYLIVDVRTQEEYDKRHIPGAVLLPISEIKAGNVSSVLPDKNQTLLIYCWTGRRAEDAAKMLADLGYTNVYEFGALVDWNGEVEGNEVDKLPD